MVNTKYIIDEGAESIVTLNTLENGERLIIKTRRPLGKTRYPFEAYAYKAVSALGSHVPTVFDVDEDQLKMSAFSGETIDDQIDLYDDKEIFDFIAKDLSYNRKVTFSGYGNPIAEGTMYHGKYTDWNSFLAVTYAKLQNSHLLSLSQKRILILKWNELLPNIRVEGGALVHGDFALSAIFVKNRKYEGIIDYGDALIGDPLIDLAYFRFKEITKEYGYAIYSLLANSYSHYTGITREYIDKATMFYMIYWATERVHTDNLDSKIVAKFIEKTQALVNEFSKGQN